MRLHRTSILRGCAALLVAGGALAAAAGPSQAAGLTDPLAPVTQPLTSALPTLPVPLPTVPAVPLPTSTGGAGGSGTSTAAPAAAAPKPAARSASTGPAASTGPRTGAAGPSAGRPAGASRAPASVAADTPVATLCLFATGGSSPAFEVDAKALGADLSSPLVQRFPQVFAPCPAGAVPAGDHVVAVDAAVQGLLGACVRVTRQVAPLQTTLVVLDRDLIRELTAAGLPLQQLVVPCPGGASSPAGSTPHSGGTGGSSLTQADQVAALASLGRLAFTGSDVLPTVLAGVGLLLLGVLLVRARTLVPVRRRH